jgi:hypothetical protein
VTTNAPRHPAQLPTARPVSPDDALGPLSEAHYALLRRTLAARRPIRNAARTAHSSAVTILVIGVAGIPVVLLSPGWIGVVMVIGICTIGVLEFKGAQQMRAAVPTAAVFLARNQLAFLALITAYCIYQMATFDLATATGITPELQSQFAQVPGLERDLTRELNQWGPLLTYGFYSLVIVASIAAQGGLALYYFTRRKHLAVHQQATPAWIRRLFTELGV